ncbi:class I SAM-dependent methyltransferase [Sporosarcina sp. FSL K6-6792]|uniref:class I SAM-dependent methyltransferase n=1 Tax=Sporosarcina sp. FSL K6-6792 TaxID=2921559 RepID=UPI0030FA10D1
MKVKPENITAINSEHWEKFYENNRNLSESTFCTEVRHRFQGDFIIIDIGCGSGRDSLSFAVAGLDVFGIDRSYEAISANTKLAGERVTKGKLSFERIDLGDESGLKSLLERAVKQAETERKKVVLYLRFLLHAIDEETEGVLLDTLANNAPSGSYFAAEFRTSEDADKSKTYDDHYRRFICTDDFLEAIKVRGFSISEFYKGTGLSIYKEEDPFLARVIAEKL